MLLLVLIALLTLGCGEPSQAPPAPGGGAGPVNVTGVNGGGGGVGGAGTGGAGGFGGAGGDAAGDCDNPADLETLASAGSVRDVARDCGRLLCAGLFGDAYQACIDFCVENDAQGLSTECVACYGAMERCRFDSICRLRCESNTCSPACLSCLDTERCIEDFELCRGLDGSECGL